MIMKKRISNDNPNLIFVYTKQKEITKLSRKRKRDCVQGLQHHETMIQMENSRQSSNTTYMPATSLHDKREAAERQNRNETLPDTILSHTLL